MSNELTVSEAVRLRKVSLLLAGRGRARAASEATAAEYARFLGRAVTVSWG